MKNILQYIEIGRKEGRIVAGGGPAGGDGFYVKPTLIGEEELSSYRPNRSTGESN
ncbi:MAG: hypothetical protein HGB21_15550 [Nitrospirae bacterium]|nr:hypothetical protein [Nitrospirota bacterium]